MKLKVRKISQTPEGKISFRLWKWSQEILTYLADPFSGEDEGYDGRIKIHEHQLHPCPAKDCPFGLLEDEHFCFQHWNMLSDPVKEGLRASKGNDPTLYDYKRRINIAILIIADKEGKEIESPTTAATTSNNGSGRVYNSIPFGLHRNKPLAEVPLDYLTWAMDNLKDVDPALIDALKAEYAGRTE